MQFQELKELKEILDKSNCPRSIHEGFFFLRGVIAGTQVAGPSVWLGWFFDGKEPTSESPEQAEHVMSNIMDVKVHY